MRVIVENVDIRTCAVPTDLINTLLGGGGFEPPKQFAADLQSVPFGHSGIRPFVSFNRLYIYTTLHIKAQVLFIFEISILSHADLFLLLHEKGSATICTRPYVNAGTWRGLFESSTAAL